MSLAKKPLRYAQLDVLRIYNSVRAKCLGGCEQTMRMCGGKEGEGDNNAFVDGYINSHRSGDSVAQIHL